MSPDKINSNGKHNLRVATMLEQLISISRFAMLVLLMVMNTLVMDLDLSLLHSLIESMSLLLKLFT